MAGKHALQSVPRDPQRRERAAHLPTRRVYTVAQLLGVELLNMSKRTFFRLRAKGELPFLVEVEPRAGRVIRYRADLVDRYLAGQWGQSRFFGAARANRHALKGKAQRASIPANKVASLKVADASA